MVPGALLYHPSPSWVVTTPPPHGWRAMADSSSTPSLWLRRYSSYLSPGSKLTESQAGLVRKSLAVMVDACRLYEDGKHGELMLSYNGGKDATVMLFLSLAARAHYESTLCGDAGLGEGAGGGGDSGSCGSSMRRCRAIYFKKDEDFSVLDEFAQRTAAETGLEMVVYSDRGFMEGLADSIANKGARAFVMGTRRDDPHGKDLDAFSPSSPSWPPFMRVNPILDWKYDDVWAFINVRC